MSENLRHSDFSVPDPVFAASRMRDVTPCHTNVTKCHKCDIAWFVHKLIFWNGLDHDLQSNAIDFREMCDILGHFETCPPRNQKLETRDWM